MSDKWSNEYWEDYGAHERQKAKGKMRGLAGAATGAAVGSAVLPGAGTAIGAAVGYVAGVASAHKDRVDNNGRCPTTREVIEEAGRTLPRVAKDAGKY